MNDSGAACPACGEPARLLCAGCNRAFCADHLERRFAMGYIYLCAQCLREQSSGSEKAGKRTRREKDADRS